MRNSNIIEDILFYDGGYYPGVFSDFKSEEHESCIKLLNEIFPLVETEIENDIVKIYHYKKLVFEVCYAQYRDSYEIQSVDVIDPEFYNNLLIKAQELIFEKEKIILRNK